MTKKEYQRTTMRELVGRRARVVGKIANGAIHVERGTLVTIEDKFKGLTVKADACTHCGVGIYMTRVAPEDLELVEEA